MKLSPTAKGVIGIVTIAAAFRLYQLWKAGNAITYAVTGIKFKRISGRFAVVVDFEIINPTPTTVNIKNLTGLIKSGNYALSNYESGSFEVKPGNNKVPITFYLDSLQVVKFITNAITLKQYPVFNVEMKTSLPLFSYSESFNINTKDYAGDITALIFSDK
jgi:hypothetical protein